MGQYLHKPEGNMGAVTSLGGSLLEWVSTDKPEGNMGAVTSLGGFLLEWDSTYTNQRGTWVLSLVWEAPCWNGTLLTQTRGEHGCCHLSGRLPVDGFP